MFMPYSLEPVTMLPFCGKRNFADVLKIMKFEVGKLSWVVQGGPI